MSGRERMSPVDLAWLRMERPTNLMMIVGVHLYEGPVDLDRLERQIGERLSAYPRFRQRVEFVSGGAYWREDPHFNLKRHFRRVRLSGGGDKAALQRLVGELSNTTQLNQVSGNRYVLLSRTGEQHILTATQGQTSASVFGATIKTAPKQTKR